LSSKFVKNQLGHHNKIHAQARKSKRKEVMTFKNNHNGHKAELLEKLKQRQKKKGDN